MIYLDNNATTALLPEVQEAVIASLGLGPSNPSSPHNAGEPARRLLADAREDVAALIGAAPERVVFASSGTEANNLAINSIFSQRSRGRLLISPVEHESVRRKTEMLAASGIVVDELPVDHAGRIHLDAAKTMITREVGLVSVQWVNHETGIIQPVEQIASVCRERGVLFHTDAAQAVGKLPVDVTALQPDFLTFTGHKLHAPMGVGVVCFRNRASVRPVLGGGSQEFGLRPGTENVAGIAGLAAACRLRRQRLKEVVANITHLRDALEAEIIRACEGARCNTPPDADRVCNTTNIRFPYVDGEAMLAQLITQGVCCSQGSACTSQIPEPSHTLLAMGFAPDEAYQSIRFSISELNTVEDVNTAAKSIAACHSRLRQMFSHQERFAGSGGRS